MSSAWRTAIPQAAAALAGLFMGLVFIGFWALFALHLLHPCIGPCIGRSLVQVGTANTAT